MTIYFSKQTNGFYDSNLHGQNIPNDCVEISEAEHRALLAAQATGKKILGGDDGRPVLGEHAPVSYVYLRAAQYPPITDYLDGVVKGDQAQIDRYIAECLAVKERFPKT